MKYFFTLLAMLLLTAISVQAQCTINFNPVTSGDELSIVGQGIDTTTTDDILLDFNGSGQIVFTYSGTNGASFDYDCSGITFSSGLINDGFQYFESSPLPVELLYFRAEQKNRHVLLSFATASELDNDYFEVQRSTNGGNFEIIGFVQGAGTTLEQQNYAFVDNEPIVGLNYYRLKQIDFDGQFEYSDLITIRLAPTSTVQLQGNPVRDRLNIVGQGDAYIVNSYGQMLKSLQLTESGVMSVNVADLPSGMYFVKVGTETLQFIKL